MKPLLIGIAVCVLSLPVTGAVAIVSPAFAAAAVSELGDLSSLRTIAADTLDLANKPDLAAAQARITDFETAWDAAAADLRARNADKWTAIDAAADDAIGSLRAATPDRDAVVRSVTALLAQLDNPGAGVSVTDLNGRPVPCEDLLKQLRAAEAAHAPVDPAKAKVAELENKGIERCNADDDKRADGFFADAIKLIGA
ncbi:MAG: hypothetical protein JWQ89_3166 [Devosia sp.]|uniref:hypothetical protein n=1 Tax=Devosia sp. TaxID=1871048 RepID=UPI0026158387|nr:hypothetical protein [Devosia sp.]MDB5541439.1 hypothetical protein [Devosia sp.]